MTRGKLKKMPKIQTSVAIENKLYAKSKQEDVKFSKAIDIGLKVLLAEKGCNEYPNIKLKQKLKNAMDKLNEMSQKYYDLKDELQEGKKEGV